MKQFFTIKLLDWHTVSNKRIMPWKEEKNPYKIWLSEIILQQTRVEQGMGYYEKFVKCYPQIEDLAAAPDEAVFKLWEGLGYYSRCKNLLITARQIVNEYNGIFPSTYSVLLSLKGVGPYTAAAIASFAFNQPFAVVDGNVFRILSRYFGIQTPIDSNEGKKNFNDVAQKLLDKKQPALYNQAIMDFGATICKPQIPLCNTCILNVKCAAYNKGWVNELPIKEKLLLKKDRWLYYFVFTVNEDVLVTKRIGKGIWENLFEFYLFEAGKTIQWSVAFIKNWLHDQMSIQDFMIVGVSEVFKQKLTHQNLQGQFIQIELKVIPKSLAHFTTINKKEISKLAFPGLINQYLTNASL